MNFEGFVKDIQDNQWNVFGVEVYENGELTHSFGDTKENLHELYSATKTVLSIAVGMVYDMGLIDLEKSILEYLPKEKVAKMSAKQVETFQKITVQRLLTMSVGDIPFRAEGDRNIPDQKRNGKEGLRDLSRRPPADLPAEHSGFCQPSEGRGCCFVSALRMFFLSVYSFTTQPNLSSILPH